LRRLLSILNIVHIAAAGCAREPAPNAESQEEPALRFEMRSREMTYEDCVAGSAGCTYARLDYPVATEVPPGTAAEAITSAIDSFLERPLQPEEAPSGINALMARFLSDFAAFKAREPRSEQSWFLERKAFVLRSARNVLTLSFSERSFLGGDHGAETIRYLNLDPATGAPLTLFDVLREGALPDLTRLAEARFRETRGIAEGVGLQEAGFTFDNGVFFVSDNFALREDGVAFYYNADEVAPYAMGPMEIVLRPEECRALLEPKFAYPETGETAAPHREQ
jgi:hypothetical protein